MAVDLTNRYVPTYDSRFNPNLLFLANEIKNYRILCMPGGTRSGKTTAATDFIWSQLNSYSGLEYSIARQNLTTLKGTTLKDFIKRGLAANLYTEDNHNLSEKEYRHNGNLLNYFGADDDEKVRGGTRNILYMNEGPEMEWNVVKQLMWRTVNRIIIDYNPSYESSWVYDKILTRKDCAFITTTYKDNPHLSIGQLDEIEWMRENAPDDYIVYGLGQRGTLKGQIYSNWRKIDSLPKEYASTWVIDFGFSGSELCIAEFKKHNRTIFAKEHVYELDRDNFQIGLHLYFLGVCRDDNIIADSAEPKSIAELRRGFKIDISDEEEVIKLKRQIVSLGYSTEGLNLADLAIAMRSGWLVRPALKGPDSVKAGIQFIKQNEVLLTEDSENAWKEYYKFRWGIDPKTGEQLQIPDKKAKNHFMDCLRYYAYNDY